MSGLVNRRHIEIVPQYGQTIASHCAGTHPVRRGAHPKTGAVLGKSLEKSHAVAVLMGSLRQEPMAIPLEAVVFNM